METESITIEQLRKKTIKTQMALAEVLSNCYVQSGFGFSHYFQPMSISQETISELLKMGFSIKYVQDGTAILISW